MVGDCSRRWKPVGVNDMKSVAETILMQLGGNRFLAMTGAKNLVGAENYLQFDVPARLAKNGVNKVRITLTPSDTYELKAFKFSRRTLECPQVGETTSNVYVENLRSAFTRLSGLDTSL